MASRSPALATYTRDPLQVLRTRLDRRKLTLLMFHTLLAESRKFSATYGNDLSNHLPMALLALHRLGASDQRLREFATFYQRRLRLKPADELPLPGSDWQAALGNPAFETTLAGRFSEDLRTRGREALLSEVLPRLTSGIGSQAFHGLIRTAYAVDCGDESDIPDALTSWVIGYAELATRGTRSPYASALEAFSSMHHDSRFPEEIAGRNIADQITKVAAMPAFEDYQKEIGGVQLRDLANLACLIYLATENFTALHLVTACHAVRVLARYLGPSAISDLATAMLAAYATFGRPSFEPASQFGDAPDWTKLASIAITSDDDHDLKLVYSCREEEAEYGWGLHQQAAAFRLRQGDQPRQI